MPLPENIKDLCLEVVTELAEKENAVWFREPVDPEALGIPNYFDVVKKPMDLQTLAERLKAQHYDNIPAFLEEGRLVWSNAVAFNGENSACGIDALLLSREFEERVREIEAEAERCQSQALTHAHRVRDRYQGRKVGEKELQQLTDLLSKLDNKQVADVIDIVSEFCAEALTPAGGDDLALEITKIDATTLHYLLDFCNTIIANEDQ
ncbi:MAG: hypothetical protein MHM6MM_007736 [Cercozoa sp. M6MM]